jgi:hypothetical protein
MFNWFNDAGFQGDIGALRRRDIEVRLQTLEQRLYYEGWHERVRRIVPPQN